MKKILMLFIVALSICSMRATQIPTFPNRVFNIKDYYNGTDTLYTSAINAAINDCSKQGGGMVLIPKGVYLTGPIHLQSNVNLHMEDGVVLRFSTDPALYEPIVLTRIEGADCYNLSPLIYAYGKENIAITGKALLDGQATSENWLDPHNMYYHYQPDGRIARDKTQLVEMNNNKVDVKKRRFEGRCGMRPQFINLYKCKNILLDGFEINRSPFWLVHPLMCENVTVRNLILRSHGSNNDGCDPESCTDVLIEGCYFDTGDDCIAIKSGKDNDGRRWNIPCKDIVIRNCIMRDGHAGVAIGSEISGSVYNVTVQDCYMDSPNLDRVLRIKSNPARGGEVANVRIKNIEVGECKLAIVGLELKYWKTDKGPYLPSFHDIYIENVRSKKSRYMIHVDGLEGKELAKDIFFKDCNINGVIEKEVNHLIGVGKIGFDNVYVNGVKQER